MESIAHIKNPIGTDGYYWTETKECGGFIVGDDCQWRFEEMSLISYTPKECIDDSTMACEQLVAYARYQHKLEKTNEALSTFYTTIFTIIVLTIATMSFTRDIDQIVVFPIKKIVDIIQKLAEGPLKKPEPPKSNDLDESNKMKTRTLELTVFKIGNLLQREAA